MSIDGRSLDLYELQAWEMRNGGLGDQVWVIGNHAVDFWGPARASRFYAENFRFELEDSYRHGDYRHPMTYRWRRW
jgi:hypothetical protein